MAKAVGLSHMAISRIWQAFGLQPHRSETFKLSNDPQLIEKVRDIVGLYLTVVKSVQTSYCQMMFSIRRRQEQNSYPRTGVQGWATKRLFLLRSRRLVWSEAASL